MRGRRHADDVGLFRHSERRSAYLFWRKHVVVPFGLTEQQFVTRYRRCLERASREFIDSLQRLFSLSVPSSVREAEVQIFLGEEVGLEVPSAWIYYQGENNRVDRSDQSIFPGRSMELSVNLEEMDEFDAEYFSSDAFPGTDLVANTIKAWLAECWWKAGGWSYPVPVKLWVHDGYGDGKPIELSEHR